MSFQPSQRGRAFPDSPMRKLAPLAEAAEAQGVKVLRLNIGQPDLETPASMRAAVHDYAARVYPYTRSEGNVPAVKAWQRYYAKLGIELAENQILTTAGGSEALLFAFEVLCDPGDEILVVEPCYPSYRTFAAMAGIKLVPIAAKVEDGYHLPPRATLEAAITPRTRALLLCNPSNPTGAVYRPDEIAMVADLVKKKGLFLIADEVYREFRFDGAKTVNALELRGLEDQVLVVDSTSKRWSACGIRIGCLVTRNKDVFQAALRLGRARLAPPLLGQVSLAAVDPAALEGYEREAVAEYKRRRDAIAAALDGVPGIVAPKPEGAFYSMLRFPIASAEDFARWLLTDFRHQGETVFVAPGPGFYLTEGRGVDEARFAFMLGAAELGRAAKLLVRALETYPGRKA